MRHNVKVREGFSLLEMIIVMGMLTIIIGLSWGAYSFLDRAVLHTQIDMLSAHCMYLQRYASITDTTQTLSFDLANHRYSYIGSAFALPDQIRFGIVPGVKGPPSSPRTFLTESVTFANKCITFSPHGIIQAGTIYMTTPQSDLLYALSSPIAQFSYMRRYVYDGTWRLLA